MSQIQLRQFTSSLNPAATTVNLAFPSNVSAGSCLIAIIGLAAGASASTITCLDNVNGNWTQNGTGFFSALNVQAAVFYFPNSAAGAATVTITSSISEQVNVMLFEYIGMPSASPVDQTALYGTAAQSTTQACPNVTTTQPNDLVLCASVSGQGTNNGTISVSTPYSLRRLGTTLSIDGADNVVGAAGSQSGCVFTLQNTTFCVPITTTWLAGPPPADSAVIVQQLTLS